MSMHVTNPLTITIAVNDELLEKIAKYRAEHPEVTEPDAVDVATEDQMRDLFTAALDAIVLTQRVEEVFLTLADDPLFRMHIDAEDDSGSVGGTVFIDDCIAAKILRDAAPEGSPLWDVKLWPISVALQAVMSRYGIARGEEQTRQQRLELWARGVFRRNPDGSVELGGSDDDEDDE